LAGPGRWQIGALNDAGPISDGLAAALVCDSVLAPVVVGSVDHDALDAMTDEWSRRLTVTEWIFS
jgi:hypothetical protein